MFTYKYIVLKAAKLVLADEMFPYSSAVIGFQLGDAELTVGESSTIRVGSGIIIIYTFGAQICGVFGIDYWTENIVEIYKTNNVNFTLSKVSNSAEVTITSNTSRRIGYTFLGEAYK